MDERRTEEQDLGMWKAFVNRACELRIQTKTDIDDGRRSVTVNTVIPSGQAIDLAVDILCGHGVAAERARIVAALRKRQAEIDARRSCDRTDDEVGHAADELEGGRL